MSSPSSVRMSKGSYGTPTRPAMATSSVPWRTPAVAPPRHLPVTMAPRRTGATSISRMKPNSRSQTSEPAEKKHVKRTDIEMTPGKRKVRSGTPCPDGIIDERPLPRTKR